MARHGVFQRVTAQVNREFIKDTIVQTQILSEWLHFHASDVVQKLDHARRKLQEQMVARANECFQIHLVELVDKQDDVVHASVVLLSICVLTYNHCSAPQSRPFKCVFLIS